MDQRLKYGAALGTVFAGIAYLIAEFRGFNSSSFLPILYLYVVLGVVSRFDMKDAASYWSRLEDLMIVADKEENKLKKVVTGEEYEIDGTVKKV